MVVPDPTAPMPGPSLLLHGPTYAPCHRSMLVDADIDACRATKGADGSKMAQAWVHLTTVLGALQVQIGPLCCNRGTEIGALNQLIDAHWCPGWHTLLGVPDWWLSRAQHLQGANLDAL